MKFFRVISILLFSVFFLSCSDFTSDSYTSTPQLSAEFNITFLQFTPYAVDIISIIDNWQPYDIWTSGTNTFKYTYENVSGSNIASIKFSVRNSLPDNFDIISCVNEGAGIRYTNKEYGGFEVT